MNRAIDLEREMWFAERIWEGAGTGAFAGIFTGITDPAVRLGRARALILEHSLAARRVIAQRPDNFSDCFERLYHERLTAVSRETALSQPQPQHQLTL